MWIDCGNYYLSTVLQGTEEWKKLRIGKLTMSNLGKAIGHSNFKTPRQLAEEMSGIKIQEFSEKSIINMKRGNDLEPEAREWYEKKTGNKVNEVGLAYPKWMTCIGGSIDGDVLVGEIKKYTAVNEYGISQEIEVGEGCIEIKCPEKFYNKLEKYHQGCNIKDFMWPEHYDQIQGNIFICEKKWCDYIVYCPKENKVFLERIYPDLEYWNECLFGIKSFFEENKDILGYSE